MPVQTTTPTKVDDHTVAPPTVVDSREGPAPQSAPSRDPGRKPLSLGNKLSMTQHTWERLWGIALRIGKKDATRAEQFNQLQNQWNETAAEKDPQARFESKRHLVVAISLLIIEYQVAVVENLREKAGKYNVVPEKADESIARAKNDHSGSDWARAFAATEAAQLLSAALWTSGQLNWLRKQVAAMPPEVVDRQATLDKIAQARGRINRDPIGVSKSIDGLKAIVDELEKQRVAWEQEQNQALAQVQAGDARRAKNGDRNRRDRGNGHHPRNEENE